MIITFDAAPYGTELFDAAQRYLYETFLELGWCDESPRAVIEEYEHHNPHSTMYVGLDGDRIVGTARATDRAWAETPVVEHLRHEGIDTGPDRPGVWRDIGGWSLDEDLRGGALGNELWRIVFADGFAAGLTGCCFATHPSVVEFVVALVGEPVELLGPPVLSLGSYVQSAAARHADLIEQLSGTDALAWLSDTERRPLEV